MIHILFAAGADHFERYEPHLTKAFARLQIDAALATDHPAEKVDYIIYAPSSSVQDFSPFVRCKAVLNLWAGVENVAPNPTLTMPLCRMVDDGLTQGMIEWVTGHVLRYHLGMDAHISNPKHAWRPVDPPLAKDRAVTILGMGTLGTACGQALAALGFPVTGWSRRVKTVPNVTHLHGASGLQNALARAEILVLLLPKTPQTENILNTKSLSWMPKRARIINPGRGHLIDDDALISSLNSGHIAAATLDVFRTEPLPKDHPYWTMEQVTVTPHIAAATREDSCADVIAENIRRGEAGEPFLHRVDRTAGY